MLAIEVELLTGRYAATSHNDRQSAEWPPHPARFFSALVAALHEPDVVDGDERGVLLWLERQGPPAISCDLTVNDRIGRRTVLDTYVPVNDVTLIGDPEKPLRDAQSELLAIRNNTSATKLAVKRAAALVSKEEKRLASLLDEHMNAGGLPSAKELATAAALLPAQRTRQVRTFPVSVPPIPVFTFIWDGDIPSNLARSLHDLCQRVTRLGHSSSLVRCRTTEIIPEPVLVPDDDVTGGVVLRVVAPGQLERLEAEFARHNGVESRVLPSQPQRYRVATHPRSATIIPESVFSGDWVLFQRTGGQRLLSSRGVDLARILRKALIEQHGSKNLPGVISGHNADGTMFEGAHVAFVPLPFVGVEHADGSIQGIAIVLPTTLQSEQRVDLLRLVAAWESAVGSKVSGNSFGVELAGPNLKPVRFRRVDFPSKWSLMPRTWSRSARRFATATPIALDKNPGNLRSNFERTAHKAAVEAQRSIAHSCINLGLPSPTEVEISLAPLLPGAQPVADFQPFPRQASRTPRVRVHAAITFAELVRGPLLLGAGRYFGLGLCMPLHENADDPRE